MASFLIKGDAPFQSIILGIHVTYFGGVSGIEVLEIIISLSNSATEMTQAQILPELQPIINHLHYILSCFSCDQDLKQT